MSSQCSFSSSGWVHVGRTGRRHELSLQPELPVKMKVLAHSPKTPVWSQNRSVIRASRIAGVTSPLHSKSPHSDTSLCPIRGVSPRLCARSSSSYYTSLDRLEECPEIPQPFDPIFPATTLGVL